MRFARTFEVPTGVFSRSTGTFTKSTPAFLRKFAVETTLRQEIREDGIATRRHFDVVSESLRDDIRIIAEGLIALDAKVETIR